MPDDPKYFGESLPYLKPFQKKGQLIVIEGTDGSGRSTQVGKLRDWLEVQGYAVVLTSWAHSSLMEKSIELAKSGNIMDRMTFTLMPDGTVVLRVKRKSVMDLAGVLHRKGRKPVSIAQMSR